MFSLQEAICIYHYKNVIRYYDAMSAENWTRLGYPYTRYEVTDNGDIRRIDTGRLLTPTKGRDGYLRINVKQDDTEKSHVRLLSNRNRSDPRISNLRKVNGSESRKNRNDYVMSGTKIYQKSCKGKVIKEWVSITGAAKALNIQRDGITKACKHETEYKGFFWEYFNPKTKGQKWKKSKSAEGLKVSNTGLVKFPNGRITRGTKSVYMTVRWKNKTYMVSRLVAEMFVPNPDNKSHVLRIDGDFLNSNASNLVWSSPKDIAQSNVKNKRLVAKPTRCTPVIVYDEDSVIGQYGSIVAARRDYGISEKVAENMVSGKMDVHRYGILIQYAD